MAGRRSPWTSRRRVAGASRLLGSMWSLATTLGKAQAKQIRASQRPPGRQAGSWSAGVTLGPTGALRHRLFVPAGLARGRHPMMVMLHGCGQDAASFARSTRMNAIAVREGFLVLYPEQDRIANPQGCWNWFETRTHRAQAEAAAIVAAIDQVAAWHPVDRGRVALAGFSAGAGLAALVAWLHPERVRAVVMHSGVAPGRAAGGASAVRAMVGLPAPRLVQATPGAAGTAAVRAAAKAVARAPDVAPAPALLVLQGDRDHVVAASNGAAAARLWAGRLGAHEGAPRTIRRGQRRTATQTDYRRDAKVAVSLVEIHGLGHAWSGGAASEAHGDPTGPDASRWAWAFVKKQFAALPADA